MNDNDKLNENIIIAIEKIAQINRLFLWEISKEESLSPIQIQIIDYISNNCLECSTISSLSSEFDLKKSTISDSVTNLISKGFLEKSQDTKDKRIFFLKLTQKSRDKLTIIKQRNKTITNKLNNIQYSEKAVVQDVLFNLIKSFYDDKLIQSAKLCLTCSNFSENKAPDSKEPHYCNFLSVYMPKTKININCLSYKAN